jgi:hypothetical protein
VRSDHFTRFLGRVCNPAEVLDRLSSSWDEPGDWASFRGCLAYYTAGSAAVAAGLFLAFDRLAGRGDSFR